MGIQPDMDNFLIPREAQTLTFVDMRPVHSQTNDASALSVVTQCRKAFNFARETRIHMALVYGQGLPDKIPKTEKWLEGFEPQAMDQIFLRRRLSCFSSPYFEESLCSRGRIILAGFLGNGGELACCIDAYIARAQITLLADALYDPLSQRILSKQAIELFCHQLETGISITSTDEWISAQAEGLTES